MPENAFDFDPQMMAVLKKHMQLSPTGESPRIGIHRVTNHAVTDASKRKLNPSGDGRIVISSSTKISIGSFYASTRADGRLQLYEIGAMHKPHLVADGATKMDTIRNLTAH